MSKRDDILEMLQDAEDTYTYTGGTFPCFLITHTNTVSQTSPGIGTQRLETFMQCDAQNGAGLAVQMPLVVSGVSGYSVLRAPEFIQDGLMMQVWLKRPNG